MHQNDIDHETEERRAEFNLGHVHENERLRHRFAAWLAILIIGISAVIFGTAAVWLP
jgi:hypothetical protein